jgi:hypothetical protein
MLTTFYNISTIMNNNKNCDPGGYTCYNCPADPQRWLKTYISLLNTAVTRYVVCTVRSQFTERAPVKSSSLYYPRISVLCVFHSTFLPQFHFWRKPEATTVRILTIHRQMEFCNSVPFSYCLSHQLTFPDICTGDNSVLNSFQHAFSGCGMIRF